MTTRSIVQAQAGQLLDAWMAGDRCRLDQILCRFSETDLFRDGLDEREELLRSVAKEMRNSRDLFEAASKPHLKAWFGMLTHLAGARV